MTRSSKRPLLGFCSCVAILALIYFFNKSDEKNGSGSETHVEKPLKPHNRRVSQEKAASFEDLMKLHSPVEAFELWAQSAGADHPDYEKNATDVVDRFDSIVDAKDFVVSLKNAGARTNLVGWLASSWLRKGKTTDALAFLDSVPYGTSREMFLTVLYRGGELSAITHHIESQRGGKDLEFGAISAFLGRDDIQKSEDGSIAKNLFSFIQESDFSSEEKVIGLQRWIRAFKHSEDLTPYLGQIAAGDLSGGADAYAAAINVVFEKSPGKAIDVFNQTSGDLSSESADFVLGSLVSQYSQKDLRSCLEWISEMDAEMQSNALRSITLGGDVSEQQIGLIAEQVGLTTEALSMLVAKVESRPLPSDIEKRIEAGNARAKEVSAMVKPGARDMGFNKFLESLEQSEDFSPSEKEIRKEAWINFAAMRAPKEIAELVAEDPELLKISGAAERVARGYYEVSPQEAIVWAHKMESFNPDLQVSEKLQKKWIGADPAGYARWLNEQDPGGLRDDSALQLVDWLSKKSAISEATEWVGKIDDPELKEKALGKIDEAKTRMGE